jgi:hypothetical protein
MANDLYGKPGQKFASMIDAPEDPSNKATMSSGLYKATTAKAESSARSTADSFTTNVKPGRKDR